MVITRSVPGDHPSLYLRLSPSHTGHLSFVQPAPHQDKQEGLTPGKDKLTSLPIFHTYENPHKYYLKSKILHKRLWPITFNSLLS